MLPSVRHMSKVTLIMGVCGCGKTTVGEALASATGGTYIEGDAYHPSVNVEKMRSGQPLTDQDRQGWLEQLADAIREQATDEVAKPCFVGCSALKKSYRDILRLGDPSLETVWLHGSDEVLQGRMDGREGHFMPAGLLASQLETLEPPEQAFKVDIAQPLEVMVTDILGRLQLR